jgi:hypothetical protein
MISLYEKVARVTIWSQTNALSIRLPGISYGVIDNTLHTCTSKKEDFHSIV